VKKVIAVIPARMSATRFPGKPLAKILDLPMIEHVRRRVKLCKALDAVYVATCDDEIKETVESFGGQAIMTSKSHTRCTDRVEEAVRLLEADIVVNVQGDEPLIVPDMVEKLIEPLMHREDVQTTCLLCSVVKSDDLDDLNAVKTVMNMDNSIMYFSRSAIPNFKIGQKSNLFIQSGIMAYRKSFLHKYSKLPQTPLERAECVDMLRILEHGYKIYGVVVDNILMEVDIPEQISKVEQVILRDKVQKTYYDRILKDSGSSSFDNRLDREGRCRC